MCNCIKAALVHGYVIRNSFYSEVKQDYIDGEEYYMPIYQKDDKGKPHEIKVHIKCCPICGQKLAP